jgi:hypothetical protein
LQVTIQIVLLVQILAMGVVLLEIWDWSWVVVAEVWHALVAVAAAVVSAVKESLVEHLIHWVLPVVVVVLAFAVELVGHALGLVEHGEQVLHWILMVLEVLEVQIDSVN